MFCPICRRIQSADGTVGRSDNLPTSFSSRLKSSQKTKHKNQLTLLPTSNTEFGGGGGGEGRASFGH